MPCEQDLGNGYSSSIDLTSEIDREALMTEVFGEKKTPEAIRYLNNIPCLELWHGSALVALLAITGMVNNDDGYGFASRGRVNGTLSVAGLVVSPDADTEEVIEVTVQAIRSLVGASMNAIGVWSESELEDLDVIILVRERSEVDRALYQELRELSRQLSKKKSNRHP
jgi:hypothetical protein